MVETYVKYLVQVQYQPAPAGCAEEIFEEIFNAVAGSFNVTGCHGDGDGMALEVRSNRLLAYGALKDLADLVQQTLARKGLRLVSGAIYQEQRHPLAALVDACARGGRESAGGGSAPGWAGLWRRLLRGLLGGPRLTPVMYFYGEVCIDLMLAARARRLSMRPAAEAN